MSEVTVGLHGIPLEPHATRDKVLRAARSAGLDPEKDTYFVPGEDCPTSGVYEDADPPTSGPSRLERILRFADRLARARLAKLSILPLQGADGEGPISGHVVIVPGIGAECVDSTAVLSLPAHPAPGVHTATVTILSDGKLAVLMPAVEHLLKTSRGKHTRDSRAPARHRRASRRRPPARGRSRG